jgi:hypothetical protein
MKKAFIADFSVKTRVIVDIPEGMKEGSDEELNLIAKKASERIHHCGAESYITPDNVIEIEEDTECPYADGEENF